MRHTIKKRYLLLLLVLLSGLLAYKGTVYYFDMQPRKELAEDLFDETTGKAVAEAFAISMRLNHSRAYEITPPELRPRINQWMESNIDAVNCSFWERGGEGGMVSVGRKHSTYFSCFLTDGYLYVFTVKGIKTKRINGNWRVYDFGEISIKLN